MILTFGHLQFLHPSPLSSSGTPPEDARCLFVPPAPPTDPASGPAANEAEAAEAAVAEADGDDDDDDDEAEEGGIRIQRAKQLSLSQPAVSPPPPPQDSFPPRLAHIRHPSAERGETRMCVGQPSSSSSSCS